jgi:threonine-phosphate decarboxylase
LEAVWLQLPKHGSNPGSVYEALGMTQPEKLIDFSVNTNPLGAPPILEQQWGHWLEHVYDYPDPHAHELKQLLAEQEQLSMTQILAGNGAAEIITLIARFLSGKNVLIIQPAFSAYETACKQSGCHITYFKMKSPDWKLRMDDLDAELENTDAVFLCQPNNPTGVSINEQTVGRLIQRCDETETLLIIDEAFYDFAMTPQTAIQRIRDTGNLLVLRSLTKMYNIAGLRLGYLAGNDVLIRQIAAFQPDWSVNALAQQAGIACIRANAHAGQTRSYIAEERRRLFTFLQKNRFEHTPSTVNFYLLRDPQAETGELFIFLLGKGIVTRHTYNFPGLDGTWLRAAVKTKEENNQFMEALTAWKKRK